MACLLTSLIWHAQQRTSYSKYSYFLKKLLKTHLKVYVIQILSPMNERNNCLTNVVIHINGYFRITQKQGEAWILFKFCMQQFYFKLIVMSSLSTVHNIVCTCILSSLWKDHLQRRTWSRVLITNSFFVL